MKNRLAAIDPELVEQAGWQCLAHLQQESSLLEDARGLLHEVRAAVLDRDTQRLASVATEHLEVARRVESISARRCELRKTLGQTLNLPAEAATLGRLVPRLEGPMKQQLRARASEVAELAKDVERLTHANAALIRTQLELFQKLMACLTGQPAPSPRYDAMGSVQQDQGGSIFETRC